MAMTSANNSVRVLALIPARSGSKSLSDKNIRPLLGKPMLAWSIEHALAAERVGRVIVSTDSADYADIARACGAEVPFLRPSEIAGDDSTDLEAFTHALNWLAENEGYRPDICVHLRPTYPIREPADIDAAIEILIDNPDVDSVRSVAPMDETPFKMWFRGDDGLLAPVVETDIPEAPNLPRQSLPPAFMQNACIDVVRTSVITEQRSMIGQRVHGFVMDHNFDIDSADQFTQAEQHLARQAGIGPSRGGESQTFCFDIDGVIASLDPDLEYDRAGPMEDNIRLVNALYDRGHRIVLFTARGSTTGIDWREVTQKQLAAWGVKHHELILGKPAADYYVDDKMATLAEVRAMLGDEGGDP